MDLWSLLRSLILQEMERNGVYLLVVSEVKKNRGKEVKFNQENTFEQQRSKSTGIKKMWLSVPTKR